MAKKTITIAFLIFAFIISNAQINNLVPNPSFEDNYLEFYPQFGCDTLAVCINWINPTLGNPDYYNKVSCSLVSVPSNERGFQYPFEGKGYYFFATYWDHDTMQIASVFREYLQVELKETLKPNKEYCVSFYVSLADSSWYATDRIGAFFSDTAIKRNDTKNFNFIPQICSPDSFFIIDKDNWTLIKGHFTANGGEKFITIGNFYDGFQTHNVYIRPLPIIINGNGAGYYVDMVSVYDCDDTIRQEPEKKNIVYVPNVFSPNSDGANDILYVRGENIKEITISIYNRWGEKVFSSNDTNTGWDGTYKSKPCPTEVYVYYVNVTFNNGTTESKSGNVTIVR
jgi:gliding motility-associated-like protein